MTVTLQHWGGQVEDVPDDVAERLIASGYVQVIGRKVETAMLAPERNAMLPPARARRNGRKKPKMPKGGKGY